MLKANSRNAARHLPKSTDTQANMRSKQGQAATIQMDASTKSWLNKNVGGQLKQMIERKSCKMELVAADAACRGSPVLRSQRISQAVWNSHEDQYNFPQLNLQQSKEVCTQESHCNFIWMPAADEIRGRGSRALPVCQQMSLRGHNLYKKVCTGDDSSGDKRDVTDAQRRESENLLTYAEFRPKVLAALARKRGHVPHTPEYLQRLLVAVDVDQDGIVDDREAQHMNAAIDSVDTAINRASRRARNRSAPSSKLPRASLDMAAMLGAFDLDRNGVLSRAEAAAASLQTSMKHDL